MLTNCRANYIKFYLKSVSGLDASALTLSHQP